jgi:hypothetical protein
MTRKHYRAIAKAIKDSIVLDARGNADYYGFEIIHKEDLISDLCDIFKRDNELFNKDRFIDACNNIE